MEEIYNIIMALIEHIPCFALMFVTHEICKCIQGIKNIKMSFRDLIHFKS